MRTLLPPATFGLAAILLSIPSAVGAAPPSAGGDVQITFVAIDHPEAAAIRRTGETAIKWLGAKMVFELKTSLARNGAEGTVAICHLKAVSSGGQVLPGMPSVTAFKLTSARLLNAANAPDAAEQLALERVQLAIDRGDALDELLIQRITAPNGSIEWRVYRPLAVLTSCTACHGDPTTQTPALQTLLRERAPASVAIGYAEGEWRGLLRLTVASPEAK
jgi:cytochrome c553